MSESKETESESPSKSGGPPDIRDRVLEVIKKYPKGITDQDLTMELPDLLPEERVTIFNSLLAQGSLYLFNLGGTLVYRYKQPNKVQGAKDADNEEKVVYSIIEAASNKGIWIREIRYQSNLLPNQLNKILKTLENKKLIKAVKSVSASKKKVYMLYNLEPDKSLTGGAWYSDQDFEAEFVAILSQQCYRYLQQKQEKVRELKVGPKETQNLSYATSMEVWKFISELGISKVCLSVEDIETILDTIVYDGKVEKTVAVDLSKRYRAVEPLLPPPGFVRIPCGVCPVFQFCSDLGSVTPKKCEYLNEWIKSVSA
ncbi:UNVERIFIED_CONTAM: hypothetical protein PYX00_007465 [Menopon gallinae]|uniref:DNA-directed RNA polymerase III subunit RPC6 n=1 Tax=Menopon gallinae TaxID=328185 RepID=A0AAW2HJP5_9NEOP